MELFFPPFFVNLGFPESIKKPLQCNHMPPYNLILAIKKKMGKLLGRDKYFPFFTHTHDAP